MLLAKVSKVFKFGFHKCSDCLAEFFGVLAIELFGAFFETCQHVYGSLGGAGISPAQLVQNVSSGFPGHWRFRFGSSVLGFNRSLSRFLRARGFCFSSPVLDFNWDLNWDFHLIGFSSSYLDTLQICLGFECRSSCRFWFHWAQAAGRNIRVMAYDSSRVTRRADSLIMEILISPNPSFQLGVSFVPVRLVIRGIQA